MGSRLIDRMPGGAACLAAPVSRETKAKPKGKAKGKSKKLKKGQFSREGYNWKDYEQ